MSGTYISCGVKQLYGLYEKTAGHHTLFSFEQVLQHYPDYQCGMVLFSDHIDYNGITSTDRLYHGEIHRGPVFAQWLIDNKLGTVVALPPTENPNTYHTVQVWAWYPDRKAVVDLLDKYFSEKTASPKPSTPVTITLDNEVNLRLEDILSQTPPAPAPAEMTATEVRVRETAFYQAVNQAYVETPRIRTSNRRAR
jgi:hypothetical protein